MSSDNPFLSPLQGPLETLHRVGVVYWRSASFRLFLKLAILFVVPATCLLLALVYTALHRVHSRQQQSGDDGGGFWDNFGYYAAVLGSESLIRSTLGAVADGAIAVAVADIYLQRHPRWFTCLQKATSKVVTLLLAGTVAGIAIVLGSFCLLVPGLFFKLNFLLVTPVIVLEDEISILSALGRSWDLVKDHRWYTVKSYLGLLSLYYLFTWILHQILKKDDDSRPFFTLTFHMLSSLPNSMFVPAFGILKTVIYIHLMVVKENLTENGLSIQVDQGVTSTNMPLLNEEPIVTTHDDPEIFYEGQHVFDPIVSTTEFPSTPERSSIHSSEASFATPISSFSS